jgi:fatty-acid desaturase
VTILFLSVYAHRSLAHRSLALHTAVAHVMRFWLWLTTGTDVRRWVAVHRKHHAHTDRPGDPHSPVVLGLARVLLLGYWYYRRATLDEETVAKYGYDCPDDWLERHLYARRDGKGLLLLFIIDLGCFGTGPALLAFGIQLVWVALWASSVVNGLGHAVGYRTFVGRDGSRNLVPFGLLVAGEELHNNHHRWPRSAKFSVKPWELDVGWALVRVLATLGLARELYVHDRRWPSCDGAPALPVEG